MPQRNLNVLETNSIVQQIMGERMLETMGIYAFINASFGSKTPE